MDGVLVSESNYSGESIEDIIEDNITVEPQPQSIPQIPDSVLVSDEAARFRGAEWFDAMNNIKITVAGVGGIGSHAAFLLSRLHPENITLIDPDYVEAVNLSGQLYGTEAVGRRKVECTATFIRSVSPRISIYSLPGRIENHQGYVTPILVCGFDNMEARKIAFNIWCDKYIGRADALFIDGRLSAEEFQVFCFTGADAYLMEKYAVNWLFSDRQAEQTVCSYKQTTYCASMIGSIIANLVVNHVYNISDTVIKRELPFMTSYNAAFMTLKVNRDGGER